MLHHDNLRVRMTGELRAPRLALDPPGAPVNLLRADLSRVPEERQIRAMSARGAT